MKSKKLIKSLKELGWELDRASGSHHHYKKGGRLVMVQAHGNKGLKKGTFANIERQTGVKIK